MKKLTLFFFLFVFFVLAGCTKKGPSPNLCPTVCDGLVAYYPFYGDATDKSGNGIDGKVIGGTLTKDRNGYQNHAYRLGKTFSMIDITSSNISGFELESKSFTVSVIVKVEKINQKWITYSGGQFSKGALLTGTAGGKPPFSFKLMYHFYPNGKNNLWFNTPNHSGKTTDAHSGRTNPLEYNHIVGVANHVEGSITLFVNGEMLDEKPWNGSPKNSSRWSIGMMGDPNWEAKHRGNLIGVVDEVRLYNRALRSEEVKELYMFNSAFPPAE